MANPYGITEVDVPGLLNVYQNTQDRRLQRLLATRQDQRDEAEFDRQERVANAWARFAQRGQGGAGGGVANAYGQPEGQQPAPQAAQQPQAPAQAEYDPWQDDAAQEELFASLVAVDPQQAMQVRAAFRQHSKEEREAAAENWAQISNAAFGLRQLPPQERAAELQRLTPMLRSLGIDEAMLAQVDLSDRGLEAIIDQSRDIEKVIGGRTTDLVPVPAGGSLYPVTPGSPYPDFGAQPQVQEGATATNPQTGEQIIFRGGAWQPVMSDQQGGQALNAAAQSRTITAEEAARIRQSLGPNGQAQFEAWLRRNNVVVAQ